MTCLGTGASVPSTNNSMLHPTHALSTFTDVSVGVTVIVIVIVIAIAVKLQATAATRTQPGLLDGHTLRRADFPEVFCYSPFSRMDWFGYFAPRDKTDLGPMLPYNFALQVSSGSLTTPNLSIA